MDAAVIAVVTYVVSHSVGSVFAAKHGYEIRANQEFLAQGCSNIFGSLFSSLPMACSLSRYGHRFKMLFKIVAHTSVIFTDQPSKRARERGPWWPQLCPFSLCCGSYSLPALCLQKLHW